MVTVDAASHDVPKPHDPQAAVVEPDDVIRQYEAALAGGHDAADVAAERSELARFEAAYEVLSKALQDGR